MTYPRVRIGDLAHPEPGSFKIGPFGSSLKKEELVDAGIPVVGIENVLASRFTPPFRRFISKEKYKQLAQYAVKPGDILVTTMGTIGCAAVVPDNVGLMIIDSHLFRMRVDQAKAYPPYLCYGINGYGDLKRQLDQQSRGAIMAGLNTAILRECTIPLPSPPEQKRIATILARADRLRRLRRYALDLGDGYLQSVFLEMFGDPITNPMGWKVEPLRSISTKFQDGPFGSNLKTEHYTSSGVRIIRLQNVGVGQLIDDDKAYISEAHFAAISKHECVPGDVIVGTLGDPNLRACILPNSVPIALNKADCVQIRVDPERATREFVCWLMNMPHTLILATGMIHGQTRSRISMGQLARLEVPIPPLPLQQQFARNVHRFERLRAQQREAQRQTEHLFQTLLHRAFQGEV